MKPEKPGIKTSEFWIALAAQIIPILVLSGYLAPEQADVIKNNINEIILAIFALLAAVVPIAVYIHSRLKLKITTIEAQGKK